MERLEYDRYGGPEVIELRSFTLPPPAADEILVRVAAASINPMDWKIRSGDMKMVTGRTFPRGLGTDFAGMVEQVGADVSRFKPGDAVLGTASMKRSGAFAPMLVTSQRLAVKKPDNLSFVAAACLPIAGVTAWLALVRKARLRSGQRLLINGALGSVGIAAGEIARAIGAEVAGRVGPGSMGEAQARGIDPVLDYTKALPSSLNGTFDVVLDCHGSLPPREARRVIGPDGVVLDIVPNAAKFLRSFLSPWYQVVIADPKDENLREVAALAGAGKLVMPIARTIKLPEAPSLIASLEQGERVHGKIVIEW